MSCNHCCASGELMEPLQVSCTCLEDYQTWIFQLQKVHLMMELFVLMLQQTRYTDCLFWVQFSTVSHHDSPTP